uniref:ABC transporter permease n=1 Tax=Magnetococcus massalia (strain MO-1) TaxID=451514 RepID=A0A1S7LLE5_MAGMO|nr:conserved membrane protein of unknown function [Candidatus Magnetococcus massalia]
MPTDVIQRLGAGFLNLLYEMGHMLIFLVQSVVAASAPPYRFSNLLQQVYFIGVRSLFVIILTAAFTGMVLGIQGYYTLARFGSEALLGPLVSLSIVKELGPVLTALMVTGRAGSAVTAELGIMRIREQVDALEAMGISPMNYLVAPRLEASLIAMPILTVIFNCIGILGGYLVAVHLLGMSSGTYFSGIESKLAWEDISMSLIKSVCFGFIVAWVCTYKGFFTKRGAEGVGQSTTSAVVLSSVLVLVFDYFITSVML